MARLVFRSFNMLLASASLCATPALAQSSDPQACELHIWPTDSFDSLPFQMGMLFPGFDGDAVEEQFNEFVGPELQFNSLDNADIIKSLGIPSNTTIIKHTETEESKSTNRRKKRRSDSNAKCYYELHMKGHYLIEDIVWGDRFTSVFDFRSYSGFEKWDVRIRSDGGNKLSVFPIKEEDTKESVRKEISETITANFIEYAKKVRRKLERKAR